MVGRIKWLKSLGKVESGGKRQNSNIAIDTIHGIIKPLIRSLARRGEAKNKSSLFTYKIKYIVRSILENIPQ